MADRKGRDKIFWLDLECTGSDDDEEVVELGAAITDRDLNIIEERSYVLPATAERYALMSDVVVNMHRKSGLYNEIKVVPDFEKDMTLAQVDAELAEWVRSFNGGHHMPLAGSGVSHYDRKYIKRDFPLLDKRLTYYALDIGSVRRIVDLAGINWGEDHFEKTHRALDDVKTHIWETKRFLNWCKQAIENGNDSQL